MITNNFQRSAYRRLRMRGFSCSDELWERLLRTTKDSISVNTFIRKAILKELKRWEEGKVDDSKQNV